MVKLEDVVKYLEENSDNEEVKAAIAPFAPVQEREIEVTTDLLEQLSKEDPKVRSWLDSQRDGHANKAIETWKSNNLDKEVQARINELYPKDDVEDMRIRELELKLEGMEREKNREAQRNLALRKSQELGVPSVMVDYIIGNEDEETLANLEIVADAFASTKETAAKSVLKDTSYTPPRSAAEKPLTLEDLTEDSTPEEINAVFNRELGVE